MENVSGNTLILAGVSMYVCIGSFGATSSPLALIPADFLCRGEGEEIWPMIPEYKCDGSKLWNKIPLLLYITDSNISFFLSEAGITMLSDLLLHVFLCYRWKIKT